MDVESKTNASTIRTRRRLHEALMRLAEEYDLADINVNQVTREAGLNRSTFYLHYSGMDGLVEAMVVGLLEALGEGGRKLGEGIRIDDPGWHDTYFRLIGERPKLFQRLLTGPGDRTFGSRLIAMQEEHILSIWKRAGYESDGPSGVPADIRARFAAAGVYGITMRWLESGMVESTETICLWSLRLLLNLGGELEELPAGPDRS